MNRHTKNMKLFVNNVQTLKEYLRKIWKKDYSSKGGYITDKPISVRKWSLNRVTDIQVNLNPFKLMYKHPQNIWWKFERDSSTRTWDVTDNLFW